MLHPARLPAVVVFALILRIDTLQDAVHALCDTSC